ncbi:MAG: LPS export ABC transporter ATP-binding protein [Brevundimonas sp.]|uniref:LPS export ABC transporter ATP-binding protein n=1 Tax=Brevundimonas sp. TaxID=1871086 RepID=UPI00260F22E6|nr:LPS export ABC transporter ATP-binding protein [Brevundimonas sp.]MDI6623341.1 LPS export ABC transporter ATP-binding protein [Brevundimonas sp.]MDQ7811980.1 LPS export ABC transporter ATP-binding protein [Brevundimonas sp.]
MARKELSALNVHDAAPQEAAVAAPHPTGLRVEHIARSFGPRQVVRDVSLHVERGQVAGLLGPNGAGKTTCFYMITGLIPPDSGKIFLDGEDITAQPMYQRARMGLGYLAQEASIFRGMTVEHNVMAVVELHHTGRQAIADETTRLLEELRIDHLRHAPASGLSGGERRRCEIARALAGKPSFMLLDEPFAGIDPLAIADIRQVIRYLAGEGIGVLITDHNVRETLEIIDHASIISAGSVLFEGKAEDVIRDPEVRRVYLGDMYG